MYRQTRRAHEYINEVRSIEKFNRSLSDLARTYSGTFTIISVDLSFERDARRFFGLWTWLDEARYKLRRVFWA